MQEFRAPLIIGEYSMPKFILGIVMLVLFGGAVTFWGINSYFVALVHSEESYDVGEKAKVNKLVEDIDGIKEILHTIDKKIDRLSYEKRKP